MRFWKILQYPMLMLFLFVVTVAPALAGENLFNSKAAISEEFTRLGGEAKSYLISPVDPYLAQTVAFAGALALSAAFDQDVRSSLASKRGAALDKATDAASVMGDPYLHLGLTAALYGAGAATDSPRLMQLGAKLGEALFLADATGFLLKVGVGRGRPESGERSGRFHPFSFDSSYQSLPSMHTASSFAIAQVLSAETESLAAKVACYTAATFVGFSRIYQDEHWTSDVLLGAAIGTLAGSAVTRYRESEFKVTPMVSGGVPGLAVVGRF